MAGMDLLMKSMGIDPVEMKKAVTDFGSVVIDIQERLVRIEAKLDKVLGENEPKLLTLERNEHVGQ